MTAREIRPSIRPENVRRVHLVAVGGVGMAALAGMFVQRGYHVTGSDEPLYPPMSETIARLGIPLRIGYGPENLKPPPDLVIVGNKVSRENPEVQALLASGLPYLSFPEALAQFFIAGRRSLVVAGTHGKTTSTAMLAWVLEKARRDPSLMVGGQSLDFGGNFKLGTGEFFVVEGDEYDSAFFDKGPKFLHYRPDALLLNAIEFDHADIYADLSAVKTAFRRLVDIVPDGAPLVVAAEFPHALEVARQGNARVRTFASSSDADWSARALRDDGTRTSFRIDYRGRDEGEITLRPPGAMNACNALGVYALAREIGLGHDEIAPGIATFRGVARRQEMVGEFREVTLIDDFAHHPTAVAGTLAALRGRYPGRRLWALFEPRSNTSRRKVFQHDYVAALRAADRVVIGGVLRKTTDVVAAEDMFSPEQLIADLRACGTQAWAIRDSAEIAVRVGSEAQPGDVVVLMSNGDFGGLRPLLVKALSASAAD